MEYRAPGPSAIFLGVVTATIGGAIDDVLTGRRATMMREGPWYLSVIAIGPAIFWLFTMYVAFYAAVAITAIMVAALRSLSVGRGWSSPVFPGDDLHTDDP